jgi:hypothetical protein
MPDKARPIPGEEVQKRGATMFDNTGVPGNEYKETPKGVIVPRSKPEGGIEGDPDIKVQARTLNWDEKLKTFIPSDEHEVSMNRTAGILDAIVKKEKVASPEVIKASEDAAQKLADIMTDDSPERITHPDLYHPLGATPATEVQELTAMVKKLLAMQRPVPAVAPVAAAAVKTEVIYDGAFGNIKAAYKKVIINPNCVALIRGADDAYFYSPPKSMENEFTLTVELPNGPEVMKVLNPGLEFNYAEIKESILVLLRVD